jgi:transposase
MSQKINPVTVRTIGIDTGKNTFHLIGLDEQGTIVLREKLARGRIAGRLANASPCLIGIEAGMATHYVARELLALGHDVRQIPPAYAKPFRQVTRTTSGTHTQLRKQCFGHRHAQ